MSYKVKNSGGIWVPGFQIFKFYFKFIFIQINWFFMVLILVRIHEKKYLN